MDRAHFGELMSDLSLTSDDRLLHLAKTSQHTFLLLLTKMLEVGVEMGLSEERLRLDVQKAVDNVPRLHGECPPTRPEPGRSIVDFLEREAFVSPEYTRGLVVPLDVVKRALWKE
jgi:hypothetical protein